MRIGNSYWIFIGAEDIDEDGKLVYMVSGYSASERDNLSIGWNMVSPLQINEDWIKDAMIFSWNSEIQYYEDVDESGMKLGKGYWAFILSLPEETSE